MSFEAPRHPTQRSTMLIVRQLEALTPAASQSAILACRCRPSTAGPSDSRLCIKLMRRGAEEHRLQQRRVTLDEDGYLILNGCAPCSSVYRGEGGAWPFVVFFGGGLLQQALCEQLPEPEDGPAPGPFTFLEHLRPHGDGVSQRLRRLARHVESGEDDPLWFDEQVTALLDEALRRERELQQAAQRIASVKPETRRVLLRRVLLAGDFIWSHYEQAITLDEIAGAARLSRFHLLRMFRQVHGVTPHAYLLAKRLQVAERLLARTQLDLSEIAARSGFGTRWSLFRHLRRLRGAGGDALRHRHETVPAEPPPRTPAHAPCLTSV
jgi:AraC family transcriptional regulator